METYFVRIFPDNVLMADFVSVWKHSIWMLWTGLAVFSISTLQTNINFLSFSQDINISNFVTNTGAA